MAATLEGNTTETTLKTPIESAEEVSMEPEGVAIETQPVPSRVEGEGSAGAGCSQSSASVTSESMSEEDIGTPVDEVLTPQFSKATKAAPPTTGAANSGSTDTGRTSESDKVSLSGTTNGLDNLVEELKSPAPLATPESISKHANVKGGAGSVNNGDKSPAPSAESKEDRINKIAAQIDEFDPSPLYQGSRAVSGVGGKDDVQFSKDINDESLIDDLIKDSEQSAAEVETSVKAGEVTAGGEHVVKTDKDKSDSGAMSLLPADGSSNGEDKSPDGSMSASTESEGFQEELENGEHGNQQNGNQADKEAGQEAGPQQPLVQDTSKPAATKTTDTQKAGHNSSPTKSGKSKRKEDKSVEHILKALSSLQTTEEKLAALCKKYADLHEEHRILQSSFKPQQRKLTVLSREKDQLQTEHTKAVMAKSKLESLCRELQKHNQTIRQESLQRAKEEDEKRKEISQKFQTTIGEIQTQMQENHERNKQLREENFELASKLKKFIEQSEAREHQVEKVIQHRDLEQKLADAKLEQASALLKEEQGRGQKEKELLLLQATEYAKKAQLKDAELTMYKERYEEFQSTIKKSEEMFSKFKTEMDKMGKRCKKLEKDGAQWRSKWEGANRALLEMAEEKNKYDKERTILVTKISKLESLCRAMQAERQARKVLENEQLGMAAVQSDLARLDMNPGLDLDLESREPDPACKPSSSPTPDTTDVGVTPDSSQCEVAADTRTSDTAEDDSDKSCASEQTGITVIQQDTPPEASQSEPSDPANNQSENQNNSDQSKSQEPEEASQSNGES